MTTSDTDGANTTTTPAAENDAQIDADVQAELTRLRDSIDNIDAAVVHMLAERFKCTQRVGHLKAAHRLPPADPGREAQQINRLRGLATSAKLDPAFAEKLLNFIIAEVIRHHERIADDALNGTAGTTGTTDTTDTTGTAPDTGE
ncbi:chorismate mutase [Streptomyces sp. LBUM 1478]|uniref:Putative chorismate mutase n=1 Tax=Streptomyces scabiei (strain 87.22) TaxID=680198 RepID=C9YVK2_STRSW|nr:MULTISPECIES: chorismate mutase [Streptomyces]MBP5864318.1 chorismate mutase [Streptomyces sp. LBUM 1484]MBP5866736.1 chorismate mutase [Streptomyces sp. LBUM 1485]MBP5905389.1 chorismate mutase [Streptomyces sp. LBUM 1478]MBP5932252.1 chorismate mutase [Streptomyces sp. LBUM 1479]MBP5875038.1 chorismate mutase [Streptomyces sp. LBUM 1477]